MTWPLLQKLLHILTSPLPLQSSPSELSETLCPGLKSSVLSAKENMSLNFSVVLSCFQSTSIKRDCEPSP